MQGSPVTLLLFKEEFSEDLPAFLMEIYKKDPLDIEDFLRVAWAMTATYDKATVHYAEWLETLADDFDLREGTEAVLVISSAIQAELFRQRPTVRESVAVIVGEIKRRIRRRLERIQEHFARKASGLLDGRDARNDDD